MINILIRTSDRPNLFKRCLDSIYSQTYKNIRIIVSYDKSDYIPPGIEKIRVHPNGSPFYFNLYCNSLKALVKEGYFFFLDDDDYLSSPTILEELSHHLTGPGVICQFLRHDRPKPSHIYIENKLILKGKIGMPCLALHHSYKDIPIGSGEYADYNWIKTVSLKVDLKFIPLVLVRADRRSNGVSEVCTV